MTAVDRAALIEAATAELPTYVGPGGALDWEKREWAGAVLDAVLPLIANTLDEDLPTGTDRLSLGISKGKRRSARMVRSLLSTDSDK